MESALNVDLLTVGKRFVAGKATGWQASLVLEVGTELAVAVNKSVGLSGEQKSELVVHTVLNLLEDAEKADKSARAESTATGMTTVQKESVDWNALRTLVKTVLPVSLRLIVGAARGKFDLASAPVIVEEAGKSCLPLLPLLFGLCLPSGKALPKAQDQKPIVPSQGLALRVANQTLPADTLPPKEQVVQEAVPTTPQQ